MTNKMLNIAIAGANGRMGQMLVKAVSENPNTTLSLKSSKSVPLGANFDILIDFTSPEATIEHIQFCIKHHKKIVIGTTGFSEAQLSIIQKAALTIPIVFSPNMSIGINLSLNLLEQVSKILDNNFKDKLDIAIIDIHHRHKIDAPSGTALKMAEVINKNLVYSKPAVISSLRTGEVVGDHTAIFATPGERLEITHKAQSRETFSEGAVAAAIWLNNKKPGLYNMKDVLGL